MTNHIYKVGDIVQLASGGPELTVIDVNEGDDGKKSDLMGFAPNHLLVFTLRAIPFAALTLVLPKGEAK